MLNTGGAGRIAVQTPGHPGVVEARAGLPQPLPKQRRSFPAGASRTPEQSFPEYKVAVEYDGTMHNDPHQVEKGLQGEGGASGGAVLGAQG